MGCTAARAVLPIIPFVQSVKSGRSAARGLIAPASGILERYQACVFAQIALLQDAGGKQ